MMLNFIKKHYYRMKMRFWAWAAGWVYDFYLYTEDEELEQKWDRLYDVCAYKYGSLSRKLKELEEL